MRNNAPGESASRRFLRGTPHGAGGELVRDGSGGRATGHDADSRHFYLRIQSDQFIDDVSFKGTRAEAVARLHELLAFHRDFAGNRIRSYAIHETEPVDWWELGR